MVQRTSPPTQRVVSVLGVLAADPGRTAGLSEIARGSGVSKPTCLGILTELCTAGYLERSVGGGYTLGPALIALGRAAADGPARATVARRRLAVLADEFSATCTASAVTGGRIVVLAAAGPVPGGADATGTSYPYAPPVGLMYVVWQPDEELERWLDSAPAAPLRPDPARVRAVAAQCRRRGYLVDTLTGEGQRLYRLLAGVDLGALPEDVRRLAGRMVSSLDQRVHPADDAADPHETHRVNVLAAPVFDASGRQSMVLTLHVGAEITGAQIAQRAGRLRAVADAVTADLHGRDPFAGGR